MKSLTLGVAVGSALMMAAGIGAVLGLTASDDPDAIARLEASVAALDARAERAEGERARLRAERNRLETQLAAEEAPPVCPRPFVSTAETGLMPFFSVEYPCGWHVLHDARAGADDDRTDARLITLSLFSQLPLSLSPRDGAIADIELADWTDDPGIEGDALGALPDWLADERARYAAEPAEERFEAGSGITVHHLAGAQEVFESTVEIDVLLWEYVDAFTGARHIVRMASAEPGARVRAALDRMARSFVVLTR